jgi:hypothetical protein
MLFFIDYSIVITILIIIKTTTPLQNIECSIENDFLGVSNNCAKFMRCSNGRIHEFSCAPGTLFDFKRKLCDFPQNVACFSQLVPLLGGSKAQHVGGNNRSFPFLAAAYAAKFSNGHQYFATRLRKLSLNKIRVHTSLTLSETTLTSTSTKLDNLSTTTLNLFDSNVTKTSFSTMQSLQNISFTPFQTTNKVNANISSDKNERTSLTSTTKLEQTQTIPTTSSKPSNTPKIVTNSTLYNPLSSTSTIQSQVVTNSMLLMIANHKDTNETSSKINVVTISLEKQMIKTMPRSITTKKSLTLVDTNSSTELLSTLKKLNSTTRTKVYMTKNSSSKNAAIKTPIQAKLKANFRLITTTTTTTTTTTKTPLTSKRIQPQKTRLKSSLVKSKLIKSNSTSFRSLTKPSKVSTFSLKTKLNSNRINTKRIVLNKDKSNSKVILVKKNLLSYDRDYSDGGGVKESGGAINVDYQAATNVKKLNFVENPLSKTNRTRHSNYESKKLDVVRLKNKLHEFVNSNETLKDALIREVKSMFYSSGGHRGLAPTLSWQFLLTITSVIYIFML